MVLVDLLVTRAGVCLVVLDAQLVIFSLQTLGLALHGFQLLVFLLELLLEFTNLVCAVTSGKLLSFLSAGLRVSLVHLDLLFQTEDIEDHAIGAIKNQGEEQSESGQVHVALRVEFASLDLHTVGTDGSCPPVIVS